MEAQPLYERKLFKKNFKSQLLEFIEDLEEPFDVNFLVDRCLQPVSYITVHDILCELVDEGKVVRLSSGLYFSTRMLMRRWIKSKLRREDVLQEDSNLMELSHSLICEIENLIKERPELGYEDVGEFVRDAIRRYLTEICL